MSRTNDLARIRTSLLQAVALVDRLSAPTNIPIDQQIVDLLNESDGLHTITLCSLIRRAHGTTKATIRLLAQAGRIRRGDDRRWRLVEDING